MSMRDYEFWFVAGSQFLYGERGPGESGSPGQGDVRERRRRRPAALPPGLRGTGVTSSGITEVMRQANSDDRCAGVVTWCHTFSPSKMWIHGFNLLQKPYCHFATQYNRSISQRRDRYGLHEPEPGRPRRPGARVDRGPDAAAPEDRGGLLAGRAGSSGSWATGYARRCGRPPSPRSWWRCVFGDNMRDVAVTEGDKVEAEIKLGWQVGLLAGGRPGGGHGQLHRGRGAGQVRRVPGAL